MVDLSIPGYGRLQLRRLVLDYNGTLARDGDLLPGVAAALNTLSADLDLPVVTADTFGKAKAQLQGLPCTLTVLEEQNQDVAKLEYVKGLGCDSTVCIGNGRNDRRMLRHSALGIAVVQEEVQLWKP